MSGSTSYDNYDNLYYADANTVSIAGGVGNDMLIGVNAGTTLNGAGGNNIFYENATVGASINDVLLGNTGNDTLRMPGYVLQAESPTNDPFNSTVEGSHFRYIDALDLRTGQDTLTTGTYNGHQYIIDTFGTSVQANAISMSALDIVNLNHTGSGVPVASSAASPDTPFVLILDQGDTFTPDYLHGATTMQGGSYFGTGQATTIRTPATTPSNTPT